MVSRPRFIGSEIYRQSSYGRTHPLAIPRVSTVIDLGRALGWLPNDVYLDSPVASPEQLARFHEPAYIAALARVERDQKATADDAERHNLGRHENPVYPEVYRRPATACGGSLLAASLLLSGDATVVYSPAGGTHHGRSGRASGFCYFNDPVLGILALLDGGLERVAYVDVDAHHGDGVEDAFAADDRVLTVSVHEAGRWPLRGAGPQRQGATVRNLAVPAGFNDTEMRLATDALLVPLVEGFRPDAIVMQCGADALAEDPLSKLALSNNALVYAVARVASVAPRLILLGGGGYNPWSVARCWTRNWAALNGFAAPDRLPQEAEAVLRGLTWSRRAGRNPPDSWFTTLVDPPHEGPISDMVRQALDLVLAA